MNCEVTLDWKFVAALGASAVCFVFAVKMDPFAAERMVSHLADACVAYACANSTAC